MRMAIRIDMTACNASQEISMTHRSSVAVLACLVLGSASVQAQNIEITLEGGKHDLKNVPVCVPLSLTKEHADRVRFETRRLFSPGDTRGIEGQFTFPGITTRHIRETGKGLQRRDLHFILPELKAGTKLTLTCKLDGGRDLAAPTFRWRGNKDTLTEILEYDEPTKDPRPILRYMLAAYDNSTAEKRNRTYKVFHHLYDPAGKLLVTNGGHTDPYTDEKTLLYPHHRGLMYAFNKISYGEGLKQKADTWHAQPGDTHQAHHATAGYEVGRVLGRHLVVVSWRGPKDAGIAVEERELTVYNIPGGTLVEFASWLVPRPDKAKVKVRLDGDPQHAGFQFRAANEVAGKESAKQTYYLRPDGKGDMGATRNWDPKTKEGPVNLPWDAMSFVLGGKRYTVAYLNSPNNPKESRFSERDYGRFGCYFEYDLTAEHPLVVNYRIWLQDGEMKGEQVEALYEAFAHPPRTTVKK
jgi:hypothetical protein